MGTSTLINEEGNIELITAECLWLRCCNCGAIYEDIWPDTHKEEPSCPHCGRTWYENTEVYKVKGPTKKHFRMTGETQDEQLSGRWERYQKLEKFLDTLLVDEQIAHDTAWRLSKSKKINFIYAAQIALSETFERVLGWRGPQDYQEIPWPNDVSEVIPWETKDVSQDTEVQAVTNMKLKEVIANWDSHSNSGLTLWEAMALRSPGEEASRTDQRFYQRVKVQLHRLRQRISGKV